MYKILLPPNDESADGFHPCESAWGGCLISDKNKRTSTGTDNLTFLDPESLGVKLKPLPYPIVQTH
jgi:hypothetical protein